MILISKIAHKLQDFLNELLEDNIVKKYKIFIRINHFIDVYVVADT